MSKPVYYMSTAGFCPRVLGAVRLGYERMPETEDSKILLEHASRCEALAAQQIMDEGYRLEPPSLCQVCLERYGREVYGIHVEIETLLLTLVGHLDRRLIYDDRKLPVEIKSLGRFSWQNFARYGFEKFISYAGQEACYLEAEKSPGIYWVMNRDTGKPLKYIVNDFDNKIDLPGFEKITLPITYEGILDNLNVVEISILDGNLPEVTFSEDRDECRYCRFKYLCSKPEPEEKVKVIELPSLVEAAGLYKEGKELQKLVEERLEYAREAFLSHAKTSKVDKFRVSGVSFTYSGTKQREYLDEKMIKEKYPELYKEALKKGKAYDAFTIRILKGE